MKTIGFRNSGIKSVGKIPWGTHFVYFYYTIEDLMDLILQYLAEGIKNNEVCLLITSPLIIQNGGLEYLQKELEKYAPVKNQLLLYSYNNWYIQNNTLNLEFCFKKLKEITVVIKKETDFEGLRIAGDVDWLRKEDLHHFLEYEQKVEEQIKEFNQLALCSYPINKFIKSEVLSITFKHDFALFKRKGKLKVIKSTERKKLEVEQTKIHEKMEDIQKLHNIGVLTNSFIHDFNNLLNVIKNNAELARLNIDRKENIENYLHEISKSVKLSSELTHRFLTYSKNKGDIPTFESVNVNKFIENLAGMLSYFIAENISLELQLEPSLWKVNVDPGQIEEILMNLIINARDALTHGGKIIITTKNSEKSQSKPELMHTSIDSRHIKILVQDNGIGMDINTKNRLFEPFFTTKRNGMGIGLTIVQNFVKQNNGTIKVESKQHQGTIFELTFPAI
ncbi:MAG: putative Histidine kinase [Promethearchaeota archaeon]|nr:MAG: putative Histidine kinase [Candidatus Lokiarchaeota archaeon]